LLAILPSCRSHVCALQCMFATTSSVAVRSCSPESPSPERAKDQRTKFPNTLHPYTKKAANHNTAFIAFWFMSPRYPLCNVASRYKSRTHVIQAKKVAIRLYAPPSQCFVKCGIGLRRDYLNVLQSRYCLWLRTRSTCA
jgi:hypothetical protein